eukprot:4376014-Pleurochrysis_carterae.AAC.1
MHVPASNARSRIQCTFPIQIHVPASNARFRQLCLHHTRVCFVVSSTVVMGVRIPTIARVRLPDTNPLDADRASTRGEGQRAARGRRRCRQ